MGCHGNHLPLCCAAAEHNFPLKGCSLHRCINSNMSPVLFVPVLYPVSFKHHQLSFCSVKVKEQPHQWIIYKAQWESRWAHYGTELGRMASAGMLWRIWFIKVFEKELWNQEILFLDSGRLNVDFYHKRLLKISPGHRLSAVTEIKQRGGQSWWKYWTKCAKIVGYRPQWSVFWYLLHQIVDKVSLLWCHKVI